MKYTDIAELGCSVSLPAAVSGQLPQRSVLGLPLVDATAALTVDALLAPGRRRVFFMNAHCYNVRASDAAYAAAVARADLCLPDGIGVELAARMTGRGLTANLNGTDLMPQVLRAAAALGMSVFLFGGRPGVADRAANALCRSISGLRIAGTLDGYSGAADNDAVIARINASGADIVVVAMGVPVQELWLDRHAHRLSARLSFGVGALLDFLAGEVTRAPSPVRWARMEWIWRLAQEPHRLARRYLVGTPTFLVRALGHAMGRRRAALTRAGMIKRALDLLVAGGALLMLAPLLAVLSGAIMADSRGSVFFRQTRIGKDGRPFRIYKFRSMHVDAEARRAALLGASDRPGICFKSKSDPRITRVGRLLRRLSLDELPQLLNVLRGEMSLVGPRPALPEEVAAYPQRALARLAVKPGITGLWQVSGRADIGFDKMIDMDLAYARSASLLLDLVLMALTARAVVSGRGAY